MQDKFNQFYAQWNGKAADFDNVYGPQCVDLVQYWSQFLGGPRFSGNAKDLYGQHPEFYTSVRDNPQLGDIFVFNSNYGSGNGHTGIVESGSKSSFASFDQNFNGHKFATNERHSDPNNIIGFLRPKVNFNPPKGDDVIADKQMVKDEYHVLIGTEPDQGVVKAGAGQEFSKVFYDYASSDWRVKSLREEIDLLYQGMLGRGVRNEDEYNAWYGLPFLDRIRGIYNSAEAKAFRDKKGK